MTFLSVDFASPLPVYEQLKRHIRQAVARQVLSEGESLPSIRELAGFLKINPNTVARAYRELAQEKTVDGRAGKGYWIEKIGNIESDREQMVQELFKEFLDKALEMGVTRKNLEQLIKNYFGEEQP